MSVTGTRIPLHQAQEAGASILSTIHGEAHVVGSVRRQKPEVGDIEILVHVDAVVRIAIGAGLFPSEFETNKGGRGNWRFWQIRNCFHGYVVDLYRFDDQNRGSMMLIRTGPAEFSQRFVTALRPHGYHHEDGYVRENSMRIVTCETEEHAFELAGMKYVQPEVRA